MLKSALLLLLTYGFMSCNGQSLQEIHTLSDDFDRSPPFYYKMPQQLAAVDTSAAWKRSGQCMLLTGTVFERDGKTPAANVMLYYYQTDIHGRYPTDETEERNMPKNQQGQTHGYIRGWVKTGADGRYAIYTVRPGTYPSRDEPAHVHVYLKDPLIDTPYYIDDFVFDDDPLLNSERRRKMENRAGSGVIRFVKKDDLLIGERNIILGLNIPDYPVKDIDQAISGKNVGEDIASFTPYHAYGPDKGTRTCPICKYGWYHGILYFVGNRPDWSDIRAWLSFLEGESREREDYLKVYFVYGNANDYHQQSRVAQLEALGNELDLQYVALTFVPSFSDQASEIYLNEINPEVSNTFLIYRRSNIIGKFVDIESSQENFAAISNRLDQTINEYFKLPKLKNE